MIANLTQLYKEHDAKMNFILSELCPNISNVRGVGAIKYLMHKRFVEVSENSNENYIDKLKEK